MRLTSFLSFVASLLILGLSSISICFSGSGHHEDDHSKAEDLSRGPHGGRLLKQKDTAVELTMFEKGIPPHFRIYLYRNGKPLVPAHAQLKLSLKRFTGEVIQITFEPINDFLQSKQIIGEPHSFDVEVSLKGDHHNYHWHYKNYEGRVALSPKMIKAAQLKTATTKPITIHKQIHVLGKITPNRDTLALIYPRYGGVIAELRKNLGDKVQKGETIAVVQSNDSLQNYRIKSPIAGTVIQKFAAPGEVIKEDKKIYEIANLDTVWVNLSIYRRNAGQIRLGMPVTITNDSKTVTEKAIIHYISPVGITDSQTMLARVILPNSKHKWLPGMFINAKITIASKTVPVAVDLNALHRWRDWDVVFVKRGNEFEAAPVKLGIRDDQYVEIKKGLNNDQTYVANNGFFLKAELGKSSATHEH